AYFTHTAPSLYIFCFLIILCPPRSTLFPYTTLFRSLTYGTLLGGLLSERWLGRPEPGRGDLNTASLGKYKQMIDAWGGWSLFQRSEEHTSELQSRFDLVCRLLLEKKNTMRLIRLQAN